MDWIAFFLWVFSIAFYLLYRVVASQKLGAAVYAELAEPIFLSSLQRPAKALDAAFCRIFGKKIISFRSAAPVLILFMFTSIVLLDVPLKIKSCDGYQQEIEKCAGSASWLIYAIIVVPFLIAFFINNFTVICLVRQANRYVSNGRSVVGFAICVILFLLSFTLALMLTVLISLLIIDFISVAVGATIISDQAASDTIVYTGGLTSAVSLQSMAIDIYCNSVGYDYVESNGVTLLSSSIALSMFSITVLSGYIFSYLLIFWLVIIMRILGPLAAEALAFFERRPRFLSEIVFLLPMIATAIQAIPN